MKKIIIEEIRDGYLEPFISETDHVFGQANFGDEILAPDGQWVTPEGETQIKQFDVANCTGFGTTNAVEIQLMKRGLNLNYSDRGLGIFAGTKPPGNYPNIVAEAARQKGLFLEFLLPFSEDLASVDEYYSFKGGNESVCVKTANDWRRDFFFKYEWVTPLSKQIPKEALKEALKKSPLGVAVAAWASDGDKYSRPSGMADNHWTCLVGYVEGSHWIIFDSYDPFIKKLEWDYPFYTALRYFIRLKTEEEKRLERKQMNLYSKLLSLLKQWLESMLNQLNERTH